MQDTAGHPTPGEPGSSTYRAVRLAALLCAAIAAIAYATAIARFSLNLPFSDDYRDVLGFLNGSHAANSLAGWLQWLFAKNNSHITFTNHLVYQGLVAITGQIHFRWLQWIGALNIPALGLVLYLALSRTLPDRRLLLALIGLFLFQLQWWEAALWAMTALSNFSVIVFALLAFHTMTRTSTGGTATCLASALLASWSQLNGVLAWPIIAWCWYRQGRTSALLPLGLLALLACLPFLLVPTSSDAAQQWQASRLLPALAMAPVSTLVAAGGALALDHQQPVVALLGGLCLLVLVVRLFLARQVAITGFTGATIAFLLLSCLLIAIGRYVPGHLDVMLQSRYKPYSVLLLLLLAIHYLGRRSATGPAARRQAALCALLAIAFNAASWHANLPHARARADLLEKSAESWLVAGDTGSLGYTALLVDDPQRYLLPAIGRGHYRPLGMLMPRNRPLAIESADCPTNRVAHAAVLSAFHNAAVGTRAVEAMVWDFHPYVAQQAPALLLCGPAGRGYRLVLDGRHWPVIEGTAMRRAKVFVQPLPAGLAAPVPGRYEAVLENPLNPAEAWSGPAPAWVDIPAGPG